MAIGLKVIIVKLNPGIILKRIFARSIMKYPLSSV
jgi:hypothetical protein